MTLKTSNPDTMPPPAALYSQVVEIPPNARWVFLAGQTAIAPDGSVPEGFEAQSRQVWENTVAGLASVGMTVDDIVRINVFATNADDIQHLTKPSALNSSTSTPPPPPGSSSASSPNRNGSSSRKSSPPKSTNREQPARTRPPPPGGGLVDPRGFFGEPANRQTGDPYTSSRSSNPNISATPCNDFNTVGVTGTPCSRASPAPVRAPGPPESAPAPAPPSASMCGSRAAASPSPP